mmetsp:Transcript_108087/g.315993  ORF Transcript_108087/g.315993 Transcript_108087/m.315993 type:complete len:271 (-) Transcript_108087:1023-1835(-)
MTSPSACLSSIGSNQQATGSAEVCWRLRLALLILCGCRNCDRSPCCDTTHCGRHGDWASNHNLLVLLEHADRALPALVPEHEASGNTNGHHDGESGRHHYGNDDSNVSVALPTSFSGPTTSLKREGIFAQSCRILDQHCKPIIDLCNPPVCEPGVSKLFYNCENLAVPLEHQLLHVAVWSEAETLPTSDVYQHHLTIVPDAFRHGLPDPCVPSLGPVGAVHASTLRDDAVTGMPPGPPRNGPRAVQPPNALRFAEARASFHLGDIILAAT